jgi:hypothetical protein
MALLPQDRRQFQLLHPLHTGIGGGGPLHAPDKHARYRGLLIVRVDPVRPDKETLTTRLTGDRHIRRNQY